VVSAASAASPGSTAGPVIINAFCSFNPPARVPPARCWRATTPRGWAAAPSTPTPRCSAATSPASSTPRCATVCGGFQGAEVVPLPDRIRAIAGLSGTGRASPAGPSCVRAPPRRPLESPRQRPYMPSCPGRSPFRWCGARQPKDGPSHYRNLFTRDVFAILDRCSASCSSPSTSSLAQHPRFRGGYPALNVGSTPKSVEIYAFAPGIDPARLEVKLERGVMTIEGEREASVRAEEGKTRRTSTSASKGDSAASSACRGHRPGCRPGQLPRRRAACQRAAP